MTNNLDVRWDLLESEHLHPIFQLYDANHPLDFYIGKGAGEQRLLLLITPEEPPAIRDMRAIRIERLKRDDGRWSLLLSLDNISLSPMFSLLCDDLIEASRNTKLPADKSLSFVLKRLSNWRRLFERGLPSLLDESRIRGLCGELLFLKRLFDRVGTLAAVKAWEGPQGADQDFQSPNAAWEVKTIRPSADSITISSEYQLQITTCPIYLVVFTLADSLTAEANAFTLNTLVEEIRTALSDNHDASELFEEKLIAADYAPRHEYDEIVLIEHSKRIFTVITGFPCITGKTILPGINKVSYDIMLAACDKFLTDSY